MKLFNDSHITRTSSNMEVLYPGNLALLSMFLKNPENDPIDLKKDIKRKGEGSDCADVLTCGSCQKDFLLADILRFIQHKVHCQAASVSIRSGSGGGDNNIPSSEDVDVSPSKNRLTDVGIGIDSSPSNPSSPNVKEEFEEHLKNEDKRKREEDEDSSSSRKRSRSYHIDVEAISTHHDEPARYTCGTCGSVLSSAWGLVQHVQSSHGIIIYQEAGGLTPASISTTPPGVPKPSHSSPLASVSSTATTISAPLPPLPLSLLDPSKIDLRKIVSSPVTSRATPLPPHPPTNALLDPTHPFNLLRMPLGDSRVPFHPGLAPPFVRPGHDFRMDQLLQEGLRLNPGLLSPAFDRQPFLDPGLGAPRPAAPKSLSPGGDPNLDFYSQRLRQLAGTTSPTSSTSPKKQNRTPHFTSPNGHGPTPSTPVASQIPTSTRTESSNSAEKQLNCETCNKSFRWETNLAIHMRVHTGDKDFRCTKCQEVMSSAQSLRSHMRSHRQVSSQNGTSPDSSRPQAEEEDHDDEFEEDPIEEDEEDELDANNSITDSLDEEEEDQPICEDVPEDLSTSKSSSNGTPTSQSVSSSTTSENKERNCSSDHHPKSVVGELMDKFGFSNISTYSEAYQQALKESGRYFPHHISRDGRDRMKLPHSTNGIDKTLKLRDDLSKAIVGNQPSLDLAHQTLLGAFDNPYEAQKRLAAVSRDGSGLYAGLWLPSLSGSGANARDLFPGMPHGESNFLNRKLMNEAAQIKANDPLPSNSKAGTSTKMNTPMTSVAPPKHERRRNDTCEYCGKIFKNCSNLTVHRRSHTGEKPYRCDLCSYACAQSSKLTRHMKTHGKIGKDVYRCRFCDMPFSVASTLEKHMRKCVVNQNNKGLFPSISVPNHDSMDSYKGFHLTSVISTDDSSKTGSIFSSHLNTAVTVAGLTSASNDDTGDSSNLSGAGS